MPNSSSPAGEMYEEAPGVSAFLRGTSKKTREKGNYPLFVHQSNCTLSI